MFKTASEILGGDFVDLLVSSELEDIKEARLRLKNSKSSYDMSSRIDPYVLQQMKSRSTSYYPGMDVEPEAFKDCLRTLKKYSKSSIDLELDMLDPESLGYVLELLSGHKGLAKDKRNLDTYLD